jgi:hypothetical protein
MPKIGKILLAVLLLLVMLPTMGMMWIKDSRQAPQYCSSCHEDPYYTSWTDTSLRAGTHAQAGISCQMCHDRTLEDSFQEVVAYVRERGEVSVENLRVDDELCLGCHVKGSPHQSREEVLASTAGREAELVVNPHDPYHEPFDCRDCHYMHESEPTNVCMDCHKPGVKLEDMPKY